MNSEHVSTLIDYSFNVRNIKQDVPGYMSPNTRSRILSGERFTGAVASESRSDEMFRTMVQDDEQHTVIEQEEEIPVTRKSSTSSFYSGKGDRSSRSNISRQQSEGLYLLRHILQA